MSKYGGRHYKTKADAFKAAALSSKSVEDLGIEIRELLDKGFKYVTCFDAWVQTRRRNGKL